jgi:uncharacterized C2H2 Zn-finger protein
VTQEDGTKEYKCNECSKVYSHKGSLSRHMKVHTTGKQHKCPLCDRRFYQAGNLRIHIRTHSAERAHACGICGRQYKHKYSAMRHLNQVHGISGNCDRLITVRSAPLDVLLDTIKGTAAMQSLQQSAALMRKNQGPKRRVTFTKAQLVAAEHDAKSQRAAYNIKKYRSVTGVLKKVQCKTDQPESVGSDAIPVYLSSSSSSSSSASSATDPSASSSTTITIATAAPVPCAAPVVGATPARVILMGPQSWHQVPIMMQSCYLVPQWHASSDARTSSKGCSVRSGAVSSLLQH